MMAKILSVNISEKKGEKKHNIGSGRALIQQGLENDAHVGMKIRQKGLNVHYGDFAENLTTEGIELFKLPLGTKLKVGKDVLLEVTQIGKTCLTPCAIYHAVGDCVMPKEGIFVRVLSEGIISVGDEIIVI